METLELNLPAMFADHHVIEVRKILSKLEGIGGVNASSAFQTVEIEFDQSLTDPERIEAALDEAGYLAEVNVPTEIGAQPGSQNGERPFFRHSAAYTQAGKTVSFAQKVPFAGRPLWPCPGLGLVERAAENPKETENA